MAYILLYIFSFYFINSSNLQFLHGTANGPTGGIPAAAAGSKQQWIRRKSNGRLRLGWHEWRGILKERLATIIADNDKFKPLKKFDLKRKQRVDTIHPSSRSLCIVDNVLFKLLFQEASIK